MTMSLKPVDEADYLASAAMPLGYLDEAIETGDEALIQLALGTFARAVAQALADRGRSLKRRTD